MARRRLLRLALLCRCPRCGQGKIFAGFLAFRPACPCCALPLQQVDSGDGPAVILTFLLGFLVIPPILLFALHSHWPMWLHGVVWSAVILVATLGAIRPAKALMVGLHYHHRPDLYQRAHEHTHMVALVSEVTAEADAYAAEKPMN
jgi:uncharacterized protein (DUF983 family)